MLKLSVAFAFIVVIAACLTLRANADGPYQPPIYDPGSKSYFQIVNGQQSDKGYPLAEGPTWIEASGLAKNLSYKGARGRLAMPNTLEIHSFLLRYLPLPNFTWIGLRYMCASKTLQWSDGTTWKRGDFAAWDAKWDQDIYACAAKTPTDYAPVAYNTPRDGFRWIAKGYTKRYYFYLVQYPTGSP